MGYCKEICNRIPNTLKRLNSRYANPLDYRRCRQCELCFPACEIGEDTRICPCCGTTLCVTGHATNNRRKRYLLVVKGETLKRI